MNNFFLKQEDFDFIYDKVPRVNVDLVIKGEKGVLLSCRSIEPNIGRWHFPGGTIYKGEKVFEAATRVAEKELGINVKVIGEEGFMEFPAEKRGDIIVHTISIVVVCEYVSGEVKMDSNTKSFNWCNTVPENMIIEHSATMKRLGYK